MELFITTLMLYLVLAPSVLPECKCRPPKATEYTYRGGSELITFRQRESHKRLRGVARFSGGQVARSVLVEVFDKPEWIITGENNPPTHQRRIAACKTGADGKFCFAKLSPGAYELRGSVEGGSTNPTHVYVVINSRDPKAVKADVILSMTGGT